MTSSCTHGLAKDVRPSGYIDLRSDTVTKPTPHMLAAIMQAELGDDGYREDPTVRHLEEMAADIMGKEAALLMPSGTMGNLTAIITHTQMRRAEIIAEFYSHILNNEGSGYAHVGGVAARGIKGPNGRMDPEEVEACLRNAQTVHQPRSALICVENSHNYYGGTVIDPEQLQELRKVADRHHVPLHLDGARIFNAAKALHVSAKEIAGYFDSVMFCLSKGLSAPAGSVLAGSKEFIADAVKFRKMLGGSMRQAGIIAAAGIVALEEMVDRLEEDNARARVLAQGLAELPGIYVDLEATKTNIVRVDVSGTGMGAAEIVFRIKEKGILCNANSKKTVRLVTHRHITDSDIAKTIQIFETVLAVT